MAMQNQMNNYEKDQISGIILIVDGESESMVPLSDLLGKNGYKICSATTGREAIDTVKAEMPDLILLDIKLPDISGYELCNIFKSIDKTRATPVIFLSSRNGKTDKLPGFKSGGIDFITKPFIQEEILNRVRTHLEISRLRSQIRHKEYDFQLMNAELEQSYIRRTEMLEAANKELEAFSYSVCHDLRAPLRAVHNFTNILLEEYENKLDDEGKRLCGIISSGITQMGRLIDDLLSFSRIEESGLNPSFLDMKPLVLSVFSEITGKGKNVRINYKIGKLHKAYGDAGLMQIVWNNLIANAIKYSSKQNISEISIGSKEDGDKITYYIKDNGVGFDMRYVFSLFGVFQRLHNDTEFEGNGVGLAIVKRIILRHKGSVWAEGEVGKGATFYFSLPAQGFGSH